MARLSPDQLSGLNVALNEANLVGVEMDVADRRFGVTLAVLSLPPDEGLPPRDPRIKLVLEPVGRLAVSWRNAPWDDRSAPAVPLTVEQLPSAVAGFGQLPIYGWEFFDVQEPPPAGWASRLSLDLELGAARSHTLDLSQEAADQYLELRVWFDDLTIGRQASDGLKRVPIDEVVEAGKRWWDALYAGDPRTGAAGIFPLKG